jgi:hypothetical protein
MVSSISLSRAPFLMEIDVDCFRQSVAAKPAGFKVEEEISFE